MVIIYCDSGYNTVQSSDESLCALALAYIVYILLYKSIPVFYYSAVTLIDVAFVLIAAQIGCEE